MTAGGRVPLRTGHVSSLEREENLTCQRRQEGTPGRRLGVTQRMELCRRSSVTFCVGNKEVELKVVFAELGTFLSTQAVGLQAVPSANANGNGGEIWNSGKR